MILNPELYETVLRDAVSRLRGNSLCPVTLRPICRHLGIHGIRRDKLQSARSVLIDATTKPVIILNSTASRPQEPFTNWERFLIAHEIGHLVLHQLGAKPPSGRKEYWKLEKLCDMFALQLLIPERIVTEAADQWGCRAVDRLRATLSVVKKCSVPWSAAARRMTEAKHDAAFFRLMEVPGGGLKVVVSTFRNHQGIGQRIKPESQLYQALQDSIRSSGTSHEIEAQRLSGIGGITNIRSVAGCRLRGEFRLAVIPA